RRICTRWASDRPERGRDRGAARDLALVRARTGRARPPVPSVRRCGLRLRRLREGALAAVPRLARAARRPRARAARADRELRARRLPRAHAALVPVPLLAIGAPFRHGGVLARARPRPRPRRTARRSPLAAAARDSRVAV